MTVKIRRSTSSGRNGFAPPVLPSTRTRPDHSIAAQSHPAGVLPNPPVPVARLVAFLADRPAVLVLDDAEHLVEACAALVGTLLREVASLRILVTSREVLRVPGEHVLTVEPLKLPGPAHRGGTGS